MVAPSRLVEGEETLVLGNWIHTLKNLGAGERPEMGALIKLGEVNISPLEFFCMNEIGISDMLPYVAQVVSGYAVVLNWTLVSEEGDHLPWLKVFCEKLCEERDSFARLMHVC